VRVYPPINRNIVFYDPYFDTRPLQYANLLWYPTEVFDCFLIKHHACNLVAMLAEGGSYSMAVPLMKLHHRFWWPLFWHKAILIYHSALVYYSTKRSQVEDLFSQKWTSGIGRPCETLVSLRGKWFRVKKLARPKQLLLLWQCVT
jgi:hypothetical protein